MIIFLNDDPESDKLVGFMILIPILLIPVIPAGDIGLYFVKQFSDKPIVILNIVFWAGTIGIYALFLLFIVRKFLHFLNVSTLLFLLYAQGIILSFIISNTGAGKFSTFVVEITTAIFDFLTSPA